MELTLKSRPALSWNWITNLTPEDPYAPLLVAITLIAIITSFTLEAAGASLVWIMTANVISYAAGGYYGLLAGLTSLRDREINVDLLMVLAAVGAALVDQWHEGAILLFLFSLSGVLETYAMGRSRRAINALLALRPDVARVRRDGEIIAVNIDNLRIGDVVVLEPGELIPVDRRVVRGSSAVNQASITGESMPVVKEIGDECFAGTLNENGAIDVEVTRLASESTLSRIIKLVEEAQDSRADTQRFLDEFEQKYALVVILFVSLLVVVPPFIFNVDFADNFYRSMVVLVVASPCALVISTPASILSAIANGARNGVLFKGGVYLEKLADIDVLAFDKTGT
ncbi:MAG: HAD-IC family P-type ATPase, partial [Chloroflexi bacterium]|nr:HAD-IC family P-type ATPase [Chloroflexota bacterium]